MSALAIITARGGSKRIPRKNIKPFLGKPIMAYTIEAATSSQLFTEVMVSTDDEEIAALAEKFGAKVPFRRSSASSGDHATTAEVVIEVVQSYQIQKQSFSTVCCLYPTAPFITAKKLRGSAKLLEAPQVESVVPVVRFSFPIQRAFKITNGLLAMFQPECMQTRSQDLEPAYHDAGQFYWLKTGAFMSQRVLFMDKTVPYLVPESEVQDIDNEEDWIMAEIKYQRLLSKKSS